jgi:integrase
MATIRKRSWTTGAEAKSLAGQIREFQGKLDDLAAAGGTEDELKFYADQMTALLQRKSALEKTAWVADYTDQHGKRRLKTFPSKKAADGWLVRTRGEIRDGTHTPESTSVTVGEAAAAWLKHCEAEGLERGTLRTYRVLAEHHVLPMLGREKLAKLSAPRVHWFRDALLTGSTPDGAARSRQMTGKALWCLKAIVAEARRRGLVAQNVADGVRLGRSTRHQERVAIPTKAHVKAMIDAAAPRWRTLIVTAAFTGLRASELRGLTWANVDLKAGTITVSQRADRFRTIGSPKSRAARRDVPLMPIVLNALRELRLASPRTERDLVFPTIHGDVQAHGNMALRCFKAAQRRARLVDPAGSPLYSVHALRHFAASLFIEQGFAPKRVQALMGHASITMTYDRYGHLFPNPEDDQKRLLAAQLSVLGE